MNDLIKAADALAGALKEALIEDCGVPSALWAPKAREVLTAYREARSVQDETNHLLFSPANAERLKASIAEMDGGDEVYDAEQLAATLALLSAERAELTRLRGQEEKLRHAVKVVHKDCLDRAQFSRDGKTVPIGNSAWMTLDDALEATK